MDFSQTEPAILYFNKNHVDLNKSQLNKYISIKSYKQTSILTFSTDLNLKIVCLGQATSKIVIELGEIRNLLCELNLESNSNATLELSNKQSLKDQRNIKFNIYQGDNSNLDFLIANKQLGYSHCDFHLNLNIQKKCQTAITLLNSLYQNSTLKYSTSINHQNSFSTSRILSKTLIQNSSKADLDFNISILKTPKDCQSELKSLNLQTSKKAIVKVQPNLNILSKDCKCKHGVAIYGFDQKQLNYLKSRGINEKIGKKILRKSFIAN